MDNQPDRSRGSNLKKYRLLYANTPSKTVTHRPLPPVSRPSGSATTSIAKPQITNVPRSTNATQASLPPHPLLKERPSAQGGQPSMSLESSSPLVQQIIPVLTAILDQQTNFLVRLENSNRSLSSLTTEVVKLGEHAKQSEERAKAKDEKDKEQLKAFLLIAQRVDDIKQMVLGIESVVGVGKCQNDPSTTILARLENIEMDVEEWLERLRDPEAEATQRGSVQPLTPSSLSPVIRHEMATSPVKMSFKDQAISTISPQPSPAPEVAKIDVATQVEFSVDLSIQPSVIESSSHCKTCSGKLTPSDSDDSPLPALEFVNDGDVCLSPGPSLAITEKEKGKGKDIEIIPTQDSDHLVLDSIPPLLRRHASTSTDSSLTSLSSLSPTPAHQELSSEQTVVTASSSTSGLNPDLLSFPPSQTSNVSQDEDSVMTLVMDTKAHSPNLPSPTLSQFLRDAPPVALVTPDLKSRPIVEMQSPEWDYPGSDNMMRLREWYQEQRRKLDNKPENVASTDAEELTVKQDEPINRDNGTPGHADTIAPSLLFSPLGTISSPITKKSPESKGSSSFLQTLMHVLQDDDVKIIPVKRNHPSSASGPTPKAESPVVSRPPLSSKPKTPTPNLPPTRSLLKIQKKGQPSKAMTRIKKRKSSQDLPLLAAAGDSDLENEEDQPPLKRVRLRMSLASKNGNDTNLTPTSTSRSTRQLRPKSLASPVKTPTKRPRLVAVAWPMIDEPVFDKFIECDSCDGWYHIGCVGVQPEDIRLSASEIYQCPPCETGIPKYVSASNFPERYSILSAAQNLSCARPKCLCSKPQKIKKEDTFVVESFVGMARKIVDASIQDSYLVKWLGYDFSEATWEIQDRMGLSDPGPLLEKFEEQATEEGIDLSDCVNRILLLKCAAEAGWNEIGVFIKNEG